MKEKINGLQFELENWADKDRQGQVITFFHREISEGAPIVDGTTDAEIFYMMLERFRYGKKSAESCKGADEKSVKVIADIVSRNELIIDKLKDILNILANDAPEDAQPQQIN